MPAHVRLIPEEILRQRGERTLKEHVAAHGMGIDVAARAGLAPQRLSQLITGVAPTIEVSRAFDLERALGLEPGTLFEAFKPELLAHYVRGEASPLGSGENTPDSELLAHYLSDEAGDGQAEVAGEVEPPNPPTTPE